MARRGIVLASLAGVAAVASVIAVSVVWPGLDAKRTPPTDASVWALQTGEGRRYARVNTTVGELDTVRSVSNPTAIAESDSGTYLFSESFGRLTQIDEAMPIDLDEQMLRESASTPAGTVEAAVSGDFVAYRTDTGAIYAGTLSRGDAAQLDPYGSGDPEDDTPEYSAEAITVDDAGMLYSYSAADGAVLRYRIPTSEVAGRDPVADVNATAASLDIVAAGGVWFLVDLSDGTIWRRGADTQDQVDFTGSTAIGRSTSGGDAAYIADETGLVQLPTDGSGPVRVVGGGASDYGTPARPTMFDGAVHAAWLRPDGGTLWRSSGEGQTELDYSGETLPDERRPVLTASGSRMILNETRSGWVWTLPDAALVASSQNWSMEDGTNSESEPSEDQAPVVIDPKPPVAEHDEFGVRAGSLVALPVLLNDHDPNEDVLSIDPESVTGLDPAFGTASITDNGQRLAVQVEPGATGSATLTYRATDGTAVDGLDSEDATVTLTVATGNSAPEWCGVEGCLAEWPAPEVAPGGTVTLPVLSGWVDPEGDPLLLLQVVNKGGVGAVVSSPSGDVVYQHPNASESEPQVIALEVTVSDTRGAVSTKDLLVRVREDPALAAQSFTIEGSLRAGMTIDVAPHVTGTAGQVALTATRVLDDAPAEAVPTAGGTTFDFDPERPGVYRVSYTVADGDQEDTAIARITVLPDDAGAQLASAPVIAFVRPKEDVTLDVFDAVSNPTGRVLLLSDVVPVVDDGANMTVDIVGQNYMRVAGTTETGAPGRLGTVRYVISDGTEDAGARIEGEATVYLLPSAPELAPIAVDDSVVVRAGAQVDIPVLANDAAPSGGAITLNPAAVTSSTADALAFGSGRVLRYLAPDEPGDYTIEYGIFSTGAPSLADTATVHVSVISDESNRAPQPEPLEGRVLSGQVTTIPLDDFGVDPDGDAVALDGIVRQPQSGSAAISADGESIVYTSVPGFSGQIDFDYRVVDGAGATGEATVRVGVLDAESNPSPVTFTDYVQVQVGASNSVRVSPLANDIDPTGGTLTLTNVRPDFVETLADGSSNPEFARVDGLIAETTEDTVEIDAGLTPGTMSFLYDVQSETFNTARGLIVVKVVRESVPDYPVVTDTLLTAETRKLLPTGVDVVRGRVSWTGGDVSDLALSLWGSPNGLAVDGHRISGPLTEHTRVIPFAVTGTGADGAVVTSYGFLRIPGEDDVPLALRAGAGPLEVPERESRTVDMRTLVTVPAGAALEVGSDVAASGARPSAECTRDSGSAISYAAGEGAPWTDACTVPVRLQGQKDWTYLSVPIRIRAADPQPELHSRSLTLGPGERVVFDLVDMTTWQNRVDWDSIVYSLDYRGGSFDVRRSGSSVTITADDDAVPGTEEAAAVGVTSHADVAPALLILRVGAAPSTLPKGGTAQEQCSQASGSSCTISVVGAQGEVNPLPGTPLELLAVRSTGACVGVEFEVASSTAVTARWTADAPGATCTATFSLRDAQGRRTNGDRDGSLLLDLQGFPKAPVAIAQSAYADGSLTLRVDPGEARQAYPALTGFVVRYDGDVAVRCSADGVCPALSAPNGEERRFEAFAVNDVGESKASVATVAWAYDPPPAPSGVIAEPIVTGGDGGLVAMRIDGIDTNEVGLLEIRSEQGETLQVRVGRGDVSVIVPRYRVGTNELSPITVTPFTRFAVPPGLSGSTSGPAVTVYANGIGAPLNLALTLSSSSSGDGTSVVETSGSAGLNGDGSQLRYGFARTGTTCTVSERGTTASFSGLPDGEEYDFTMCVESWRGGESFGRSTVTEKVRAVQSTDAPRGFTFVVDARPYVSPSSHTAYWSIKATPTSTEALPRNNVAEFTGGPPTGVYDRNPGIRVRYTHEVWGTSSDWAAVTPRAGSAPYQVWARWSVSSCVGGSDMVLLGRSSNDPQGGTAAFGYDPSGLVFYDVDGNVLPHDTGTWSVPVGATRVEGVQASANWDAQGWGLNGAAATFGANCNPNLPPEDDTGGADR